MLRTSDGISTLPGGATGPAVVPAGLGRRGSPAGMISREGVADRPPLVTRLALCAGRFGTLNHGEAAN